MFQGGFPEEVQWNNAAPQISKAISLINDVGAKRKERTMKTSILHMLYLI